MPVNAYGFSNRLCVHRNACSFASQACLGMVRSLRDIRPALLTSHASFSHIELLTKPHVRLSKKLISCDSHKLRHCCSATASPAQSAASVPCIYNVVAVYNITSNCIDLRSQRGHGSADRAYGSSFLLQHRRQSPVARTQRLRKPSHL